MTTTIVKTGERFAAAIVTISDKKLESLPEDYMYLEGDVMILPDETVKVRSGWIAKDHEDVLKPIIQPTKKAEK